MSVFRWLPHSIWLLDWSGDEAAQPVMMLSHAQYGEAARAITPPALCLGAGYILTGSSFQPSLQRVIRGFIPSSCFSLSSFHRSCSRSLEWAQAPTGDFRQHCGCLSNFRPAWPRSSVHTIRGFNRCCGRRWGDASTRRRLAWQIRRGPLQPGFAVADCQTVELAIISQSLEFA